MLEFYTYRHAESSLNAKLSFGDGSQSDILGYQLTVLLLCGFDIADLQGGCRILWDIMGKFLLGFLHYAPPYPCHFRCAVYFNTIELALFAQSASGYFSSSGQKYWFRLKIQPESIQTIIMA